MTACRSFAGLEAQNSARHSEARMLLQHFLSGAITKNGKSLGKRPQKPNESKFQKETLHPHQEVHSVTESAEKTESVGSKKGFKVAKLQWLKG